MTSLSTCTFRLRRLLKWALIAGGLASFTPAARAVTFTVFLPMPGLTTGITLDSATNPTLGTFDFSSTTFPGWVSIQSVSLTLALYDLQTMSVGSGNDRRDFNNISLTLGGFNTGLLLNEYPRLAGTTRTTSGSITNGAAILQALQTNNGLITFGIQDATTNQPNTFDYFGGTASLTFDVSVPFSPSTSTGLGLVAAFALFRNWSRVRRVFAKAAG